MEIHKAEFVKSSSKTEECPAIDRPEYAFIGRSNVGKSSLINMLTKRKALAKTSGKPGKTQLINHFNMDEKWYLVDLPGYGYAKTSKTDRAGFQKMIRSYIESRPNLVCLFVLIDSRLDAQKNDLEFMQWLGNKRIPFAIVFTKVDKLSSNQLRKNASKYRKRMLEQWSEMPQNFFSSAETGIGKNEILNYIDHLNTETAQVNWKELESSE